MKRSSSEVLAKIYLKSWFPVDLALVALDVVAWRVVKDHPKGGEGTAWGYGNKHSKLWGGIFCWNSTLLIREG